MQVVDFKSDTREQEGGIREQKREGGKSKEQVLNWSPSRSIPWDIPRDLQLLSKWKGVATVHQLLTPVSSHFQRGPGAGSKDGRPQGRSWQVKPHETGCSLPGSGWHIRARGRRGPEDI